MADRRVTRSRKDDEGDIIALCHPGQYWSPRSKPDAISDIENGDHSYYVEAGGSRANVRVVRGPNGKYLRTDSDNTSRNNLDDLPDC